MHCNQHCYLNAQYDTVHRLELVIVKQSSPENLETPIEQGSKGTNKGESFVIKTTPKAKLLERT